MIVTNTKTAPAYPGQGVKITINPAVTNDAECLSWFYPGMEVTSDATGDKGVIVSVDRKGSSFIVAPAQPNLNFQGSANYKFKPTDTISFNENKIGNLIWKLDNYSGTQLKDGTTLTVYNVGNTIGNLPGALNPNNSAGNVAAYGYLYNGWARDLLAIPTGWRIPIQDDVQDLCSSAGGDPVSYPPYVKAGKLRQTGTTYWNSATGAANFKNFNARGAGNGALGNGFAATVSNFKVNGLIHFYYLNNNMSGYLTTLKSGYVSGLWFTSGSDFSSLFTSASTSTIEFSLRTAYTIRLCRNYDPNAGIS